MGALPPFFKEFSGEMEILMQQPKIYKVLFDKICRMALYDLDAFVKWYENEDGDDSHLKIAQKINTINNEKSGETMAYEYLMYAIYLIYKNKKNNINQDLLNINIKRILQNGEDDIEKFLPFLFSDKNKFALYRRLYNHYCTKEDLPKILQYSGSIDKAPGCLSLLYILCISDIKEIAGNEENFNCFFQILESIQNELWYKHGSNFLRALLQSSFLTLNAANGIKQTGQQIYDIRNISSEVPINFARADLREVDLWGANLEGADLTKADLRGAELRVVYWEKADLREADLEGAYLRKVNLRGANLEKANLRRAGLEKADLRGADLTKADL